MIKVIGAGFGRTGTTSLKLALERLGFGPCYHFTEIVKSGHVAQWLSIAQGEAADWDALFQDYSATADWPAAKYWRELSEHYPDALVILSVRNPDTWYRSISKTLLPLRRALRGWLLYLPLLRNLAEITDRIIWNGTFGGKADDQAQALAVYDRHCAEVRKSIAPERLLEFDVRDGWGPLCRFLGVPAPQGEPFPRTNETMRARRLVTALRVARILVPVAVGLTCVSLLLAIFSG